MASPGFGCGGEGRFEGVRAGGVTALPILARLAPQSRDAMASFGCKNYQVILDVFIDIKT